MAKACGVDRDLLVFANTIPDMMKLVGCSTLIIEPSRSATGQSRLTEALSAIQV
jgi:hypothetical protein